MANKINGKRRDEVILPEEVHFKCWKVENGEKVALEELSIDVTEEFFNMALASYRTGKYEYMNEDEKLQTDVSELTGLVRVFEELDESTEVLLEYMEEVKNRKRLTREEIAYYKGDGRVECPEDDYKYVKDIDTIVNYAQFDVMTRQKKRERYEFNNDAEYRLYLVTLYDYAQLDEM